jgi:hypothetical protein
MWPHRFGALENRGTELAGEPGLREDQLRKLRQSGISESTRQRTQLRRNGFAVLVDLRKTFPFLRFVLTNAETNLSSAEPTIMDKYATYILLRNELTPFFIELWKNSI